MDMRSEKYPYRLDVERRLPNGSLTTTAMRRGIRSSFGTGDMRAAMFSGVSGLTAQTGRTGVSTTTVNNY